MQEVCIGPYFTVILLLFYIFCLFFPFEYELCFIECTVAIWKCMRCHTYFYDIRCRICVCVREIHKLKNIPILLNLICQNISDNRKNYDIFLLYNCTGSGNGLIVPTSAFSTPMQKHLFFVMEL
jgi:hypothetical protein